MQDFERRAEMSRYVIMLLAVLGAGFESRVATAQTLTAVDHERRTIYHSPQSPGYTCWCGAWTMPDGSIMTAFTQATGPVKGRPSAPAEVLTKLSWPFGEEAGFDMTGLDMRNVHLRSHDFGKTWKQVSADLFRTCMNGVSGEAEFGLDDGTIVRAVEGYYLPFDNDHPRTGFLQRSTDGTKTWGKAEVVLDAARFTVFLKRIRQLRDGRLVIVGGVAEVPANSRTRVEYSKLWDPLLAVSSDNGKTWQGPIPVVPKEHRGHWGGEECDVAELASGDLLFVFRRPSPTLGQGEIRSQGVMKKSGSSWEPAIIQDDVFPHSGHPELLATREGPVLHLATTGIHSTTDGGATWQRLELPGTSYYPRSIQAKDGRIIVIGHIGADDAYGKVDQSIVMDSFRLKRVE